jgi:hypothetical protein
MEHWYAFQVWNGQTQYGFGTEAEADRYVDQLNAGRDINHFVVHRLDAAQARLLRLEERDDVFSLAIALSDSEEA